MSAKARLTVKNGRFSFLLADRRLGWAEMRFDVETGEGAETLAGGTAKKTPRGATLAGSYPLSGLTERVEFAVEENALTVRRTLANPGARPVLVREASAGRLDGDGGPVFSDNSVWRARFCHMDNVRREEYPWCRPEFPYIRPLPAVEAWFGRQESQPVPVIMFLNDSCSEVLLEGQLAQDRTRAAWLVKAGPRRILDVHRLAWTADSGGLCVPAGGELALEPVRYEILTGVHPQEAWADYFRAIAPSLAPARRKNVLHGEAFYCSWNYGIGRNISETGLLATARCVAKSLPGVRFFLIDGGWRPFEEKAGWDTCSLFYLPEKERYDPRKFPHGMKVMAEKLRKTGVRPALWWTPSLDAGSKLAREKRGWLLKDGSGAPYQLGPTCYLDYSLPEVREYLRGAFDTIFNKWGYEGMKMDFWSQSVESRDVRFAAGTGIEARDWLLGTIRSYIPKDGFFMTCVSTAMGNPFLGKHAESYRACIDVGNFTRWEEHVYASCWIQPLLSIPGRETCLLNADGLGVNPGRPDDENIHRLTYGFITMGSIEVDGRIEELAPRHVEWLRRLTTHIDRGYPVLCPDGAAFTGDPYPKVLVVRYPAGSPTRRRGVAAHVALFNWGPRPAVVGATMEELGLPERIAAREFWTDEEKRFSGAVVETLRGRSARLYEIAD